MPTIFDNIRAKLSEGLGNVLPGATAASFCVGYLNLRGWGQLADLVESLSGGDRSRACRLLVGIHHPRGWVNAFRSAALTWRRCIFAPLRLCVELPGALTGSRPDAGGDQDCGGRSK